MYWNPPANGTIIDVQIEETPGQEGIYYIAESYEGQRVDRELVKLYPMEDNVKIYKFIGIDANGLQGRLVCFGNLSDRK